MGAKRERLSNIHLDDQLEPMTPRPFFLTPLGALLLAISVFVVGGATVQLLLRHIFRYQISSKAIRGLLFGSLPLFSVPLDDVIEVRRCAAREVIVTPLAWRWGNRIWGSAVLIVRRHGIIRKIFLSPDAPDTFVADVKLKAGLRRRA